MKKFLAVIVAVVASMFVGMTTTSCGDDDVLVTDVTSEQLQGSWKATQGSDTQYFHFAGNVVYVYRDLTSSTIAGSKNYFTVSGGIIALKDAKTGSTSTVKVLAISTTSLTLKGDNTISYTKEATPHRTTEELEAAFSAAVDQ